MFSERRHVYMLKTKRNLILEMSYFFNGNLFMKCVYLSETMNFVRHLNLDFFFNLFLHICV